ncbi:MAG: ABC transporter substrate-binding protein [Candidatus Rokuibacteriota bacterium]
MVTRRIFLRSAAAGIGVGAFGRPPGVLGQAKKFQGVTINGAMFQHVWNTQLKEYIPEFETKTGMKVNLDLQAFPVYNQRADLELSTKGSAWDVLNVTFVYSGRWVGAGWFTPLEEFVRDRNRTEPEWNADDFVPGTMAPFVDARGTRYGFPWEAGTMLLGASRGDLIEKAGLKLPETFADLVRVCESVHDKDGVKAFVADRLHHWNWIPYLMGYGGKVFRDPPEDLTPMLDTPEAARAAEFYADLLQRFAPQGVLSFTDDQTMTAQLTGRANMRTQALPWLATMSRSDKSVVKSTVRYAMMPAGPAGNFPGSNSHALGIPLGAKNKEAAWEFIKWAVSPELTTRMLVEKGYSAICRRSVIDGPEFRKTMTLNGQDVGALYVRVLALGGKTGYMKYRTVPVFPQVGDKINKAMERIVTRQQSAVEALKQAQAEAVIDLRKAGVKI